MTKDIFNELNINNEDLKQVCQKHKVKSLFVFGSATNDSFKNGVSDIDFLVEFENVTFDSYFDFLEELQKLLNYEKIDLVTLDSVKNKIINDEINSTKEILYAA